ncbi:hypothetical protein Scep_019775 [Stephania cephalantha]|uniref:Uncharacterized protein n=1 Tax=Stephania cephalantha TaxID=152367 RepID=A0AAP0NQ58_9MAGN
MASGGAASVPITMDFEWRGKAVVEDLGVENGYLVVVVGRRAIEADRTARWVGDRGGRTARWVGARDGWGIGVGDRRWRWVEAETILLPEAEMGGGPGAELLLFRVVIVVVVTQGGRRADGEEVEVASSDSGRQLPTIGRRSSTMEARTDSVEGYKAARSRHRAKCGRRPLTQREASKDRRRRRFAAAAVHSTTTMRRPHVNVSTTGRIRTTEGDGRPILLAPDGEMDAEAIAGEKKMKGEVKEDGRGFKGLEYV